MANSNYWMIEIDDTHRVSVWKSSNGSQEYRPEYWKDQQWHAYTEHGAAVVYSSVPIGNIAARTRALRHTHKNSHAIN